MSKRTDDMNQRTRDLWLQAASRVSPLKTGGEWQKEFVGHFAEMIVADITGAMICLSALALEEGKIGISNTCLALVEKIKEDYEVE